MPSTVYTTLLTKVQWHNTVLTLQWHGPGRQTKQIPLMQRKPPHHTTYAHSTHTLQQQTKHHKRCKWRDLIHITHYHFTLNGQPNCLHQVLMIAWHFWGTRDELSIEDGLLLKGTRVCILPELHDRTITELHECDQGIEKMQLLAKIHHILAWHRCIHR